MADTITIDNVEYSIDSLTDKGKGIITNLQKINEVIQEKQFEVTMPQLARAALLSELAKEVPNFRK